MHTYIYYLFIHYLLLFMNDLMIGATGYNVKLKTLAEIVSNLLNLLLKYLAKLVTIIYDRNLVFP